MDRVRRIIHADREEISSYDGSGVTVAILDTGIAMHPDFAQRLIGFRDFVSGSRLPYDDSGHGTHVAGCLGGSGGCSDGLYRGIAPGCRIVAGKVLDSKGDGTITNMAAGIEWVIKNKELYQIRVLNISISMGETQHPEGLIFLASFLEQAWDEGIFVTVAAGNKGPKAGSISPLGAGKKTVAVGCHDGREYGGRSNACEQYSGRGPANAVLKKPDIVAPGTDVVSCNAGYRRIHHGYRDAYTVKNGTSMSTPLVSGAAALCFQKFPEYTNEQVKRRLLWSASDLGEPWSKQGWGMLDVERMMKGI